MQHTFADGKYTVINDNGRLTALRHGEHWDRDLCGDNLIYWMLVDYDKMKEERDELLKALNEAIEWNWFDEENIPCVIVEKIRNALAKGSNA